MPNEKEHLDLVLLPWHRGEKPLVNASIIVRRPDGGITVERTTPETAEEAADREWMYLADLAFVLRRVEQIEKNHEHPQIVCPDWTPGNWGIVQSEDGKWMDVRIADGDERGTLVARFPVGPHTKQDCVMLIVSRLLFAVLTEIVGDSDYVRIAPCVNRATMDRAINALMLANGVTPPSNPRPNIIRVKGAKP